MGLYIHKVGDVEWQEENFSAGSVGKSGLFLSAAMLALADRAGIFV